MSQQPPENPPAWAPPARPSFSDMDKGAEKIWQAAVPAPARPPTPRVMVQQLYGRTSRGRPNTRAAADALGVSQRTVQRWIKDRKLPTSDAGAGLRRNHAQWSNSPAGRAHALGRKNRAQLQGARRITFTGTVKISGDVRDRKNMQIDIADQALLDRVIDRLADGDDLGALSALEDLFYESADFGADVGLAIETITFS